VKKEGENKSKQGPRNAKKKNKRRARGKRREVMGTWGEERLLGHRGETGGGPRKRTKSKTRKKPKSGLNLRSE